MSRFQPLDPQPLDADVLEQALHWMVQLQSGVSGADEQHACAQWRAQHPEHERAWQRLNGLNHDLRATTRTVPAASARHLLNARGMASRRSVLKGLAGMALVGASGLGVRERVLLPELFSDYHTGTGERRHFHLPQGTRLQLDARSALDSQDSADGLLLTLNLGRILLETGAQATLRVRTAQGWVRPAASSRLVIGEDLPGQPGSLLQVFAGSAGVESLGGARQSVQAGQQLGFSRQRLLPWVPLAATEAAWTEGMLVAERMPLGLLLAQLDRYRHGVLRCAPEVAGLPVSGSYSLDRSDASLDLLARMLPIRVNRVLGVWTTVGPA